MIYYQTFGNRQSPPLLLLHSGGLSSEEWKPQIEIWAQRYFLIVPDLPGHGKSLLPENQALTLDLIVAELIDLLDELQIETVNVCGSSMGGASALKLALRVPERIQRLIIYRISYYKNQATYEQTKIMANPDYWRKFGLHSWLSELHSAQGGADAWQQVIQRVNEALNPENGVNTELTELKNLNMPVLIIAGDRDPVAPLDEVLAMHKTLSNSSLWILPHTDHITATNTWRASAFAEEIKRFLSKK